MKESGSCFAVLDPYSHAVALQYLTHTPMQLLCSTWPILPCSCFAVLDPYSHAVALQYLTHTPMQLLCSTWPILPCSCFAVLDPYSHAVALQYLTHTPMHTIRLVVSSSYGYEVLVWQATTHPNWYFFYWTTSSLTFSDSQERFCEWDTMEYVLIAMLQPRARKHDRIITKSNQNMTES